MCPTRFAGLLLILLTLAPSARSQPAPTPADRTASRPNILFVFTDDHTAQAIGAYGSRLNRTPRIDQLAIEGVRFDNCYVTNSICGPCRAVVQTGTYSHVNGVYHNRNALHPSQAVMPRLLQQAGYQTALIGKWHLQNDPAGYDHWEVLIGQGPYYNPPMIRNGQRVQHIGYTTDVITDLALAWLRDQRDPEKPFLLMYQHKAPHRPWDPSPRHLHLYEDETIPEPPTLLTHYGRRGTAARQQDMTIAETLDERDLKLVAPTELNDEQRAAWNAAYEPRNIRFREHPPTGVDLVRWKYQRYIKDYLRCVAALDENLGRLLDYLDEAGLAENTIVIYTSDQGFYLGEQGWFDKRWMYDISLRMPLLVRWPGVVAPGTFQDAIVSVLDFMPTFLEVAGAEIPTHLHGRSLVPLLRGERPADWRTTFYYHYYEYPGWHYVRKHYGVTDSRFKLMHFYEADVNEWELYDLKFDPDETHNLYGHPVYGPVQERLLAALKEWRTKLAVPESDPPESELRDFPHRTRIRTTMP
ncbi:MAG: sulfatase [Phycisphaerales bacterium]|nr:sulfatase [Phycisphaerales bacterium]